MTWALKVLLRRLDNSRLDPGKDRIASIVGGTAGLLAAAAIIVCILAICGPLLEGALH